MFYNSKQTSQKYSYGSKIIFFKENSLVISKCGNFL